MSKSYLLDPPSPYDVRRSKPAPLSSSASLPSGQGSPAKRKKYPPTPISHLPGTGRYALDSYRIFCTTYENPSSQEWKAVVPTDKKLIQYVVGPSYLQMSVRFTELLSSEVEMGCWRVQRVDIWDHLCCHPDLLEIAHFRVSKQHFISYLSNRC